jgi:putative ABC transport system permease protein
MFDLDRWAEIGHTLRQHPLRTALTAFGVFWGMLLLVVLQGAGKGLEHGVMNLFKSQAYNGVWLGGGTTSLPYQGLPPGRKILFSRDDIAVLASIPGMENVSPERYLANDPPIRYKQQTRAFPVFGVYPGYAVMQQVKRTQGRLINPLDVKEGRKVAVIGPQVKKEFFGGRNAVGEYLSIYESPLKIIGVFEDAGPDIEKRRIYIPYTTFLDVLDPEPITEWISFTTSPSVDWKQLQGQAMHYLANKHRFDPKDAGAIFAYDQNVDYQKLQTLLRGVRLFVSIVGIGSLLAGCVGVSNIMLVAVNERTREIGIRKALGATPNAILAMILQEALLITIVSGGFGLMTGVAFIETLRRNRFESEYFRDPEVDLLIAMAAFAILILAGVFAGFLPARNAVKIEPIEALRHE